MPDHPRPRQLFPIFLRFLAATVLSASAARADITLPETRLVPTARDGTVRAVRGIPVAIALEGGTGSARALEFEVRRQPRIGRIAGAPQPIDKLRAAVTYIADPAATGVHDSFTFVTRAAGATSLEATVTIEISDPAADIRVAPVIETGQIMIGRPVNQEMLVRNAGNAPWRAKIDPPEGWSWVTPANGEFSLDPESHILAILRIDPQRPGPVRRTLQFAEGRTTRITGNAVPPFTAFPAVAHLQWEPVTRTRTGTIEIQNNTEFALETVLTGPKDLQIPERVTVEGHSSVEVPIALTSRVDTAVENDLLISVQGYRQEVRYEAPVAPARIEIAGFGDNDTIDFGLLDAAALPLAVREISVRNVGGQPTMLTALPPRLFLTPGFEADTKIEPGGELAFRILPRQDVPGTLEEKWVLQFAGGMRDVLLRAEVTGDAVNRQLNAPPPLLPGKHSASPDASLGHDKPLSRRRQISLLRMQHEGIVQVDPDADPSLPKIDDVRIVTDEPQSIVFDIDPPAEGDWTYTVLHARVLPRPGRNGEPMTVVKMWVPWEKVEFSKAGKATRATLSGLVPGELIPLRIKATRSDGVSNLPGRELRFLTKAHIPKPWGWIALWTVTGCSALMWVRQKWREDVSWTR